jgi:cellulose synthase/poly-beta-1,6-N-acetylglucosamine synthase-like glycosyltransferase
MIVMLSLNILLAPVIVLYFLVVAALFVYGVNSYYMTFNALSLNRQPKEKPLAPLQKLPRVTVQLPIYNERFVARRLIEAAASLEYPRELLEIQVLDDSTDDTETIVAETVNRLHIQGVNVLHLHRQDRRGFKAGALADGMKVATGEFIAIFDADFIPAPDFLQRALPYFEHERIAFVQARWGHLNSDYSLLTFLQALSIDSHFIIEQFSRSRLDYWFNFNGTAGIWRKTAIEDAGGWKAETLTEDLDLSYRAYLRGWEARYASEIVAPAELPVSMAAFRRQQHRWARGSLECAIKFAPMIWESKMHFLRKFEAIMHLTGYGIHLLLFILSILYPFILVLSTDYPAISNFFGLVVLFNLTGLAPTLGFIVGQRLLGRDWLKLLPKILFITVCGMGMMVNTLRAALHIGLGKKAVFERTPKYGITRRGQVWDAKQYQIRVDNIVIVEILVALLNTLTAIYAFQLENYLVALYAGLFAFGLFFISGSTVVQAISNRRANSVASQELP